MFRKIVTENCRKIVLKTSKARFKAAVFESCCSKMFEAAAQTCSSKLLLFPAGPEAVQSCSPKLLPKAVRRRCSPKLFSKAVAPKLRFCKPVHQNGSPKLFCKAVPNLLPKAAPPSCCSSKQLFCKAVLES